MNNIVSWWQHNQRIEATGFLVSSWEPYRLAIELTTTHTTDDAHKTVKMITHGEFSKPFWFGMILAGNIVPILLLFAGVSWAFVLSGILILIGLWFAEDIWVKAPQRIPLS